MVVIVVIVDGGSGGGVLPPLLLPLFLLGLSDDVDVDVHPLTLLFACVPKPGWGGDDVAMARQGSFLLSSAAWRSC